MHKRFVSHGGPTANAAVAAQLTMHAATAAQQSGVDFLHIDSTQQAGATFGKRLSRAMEQAFALGYEQLLVIGNDCPQLDTPLLRRALARLAEGGVVLGPATDGGVYLMGVARSYFEATAWGELPWQTAALGQALVAHCQATGATVHYLQRLADVDNEQDLAQLLRQPLTQRLRRVLQGLRRLVSGWSFELANAVPQPAFAASQPHRGPPSH